MNMNMNLFSGLLCAFAALVQIPFWNSLSPLFIAVNVPLAALNLWLWRYRRGKISAGLHPAARSGGNPLPLPPLAREALEVARKRIAYFGTISDDRHREANEQYFFPPIDAALALPRPVSNSEAK